MHRYYFRSLLQSASFVCIIFSNPCDNIVSMEKRRGNARSRKSKKPYIIATLISIFFFFFQTQYCISRNNRRTYTRTYGRIVMRAMAISFLFGRAFCPCGLYREPTRFYRKKCYYARLLLLHPVFWLFTWCV